MEPENPRPLLGNEQPPAGSVENAVEHTGGADLPPRQNSGLRWVFMGPQGLRAGWSAAIFMAIFMGIPQLLVWVAKAALKQAGRPMPGGTQQMTPLMTSIGEGVAVLFLLGMLVIMALIERRHPMDYYLRDRRILPHTGVGLVCGFAALSALLGAMWLGGWAHLGGLTLNGAAIVGYAAAWGGAFLLVGCLEEGMFRCYLQFTFARGINFWWAVGVEACICGDLLWRGKGNGIWGVYGLALLGLLPCLWLQMKRVPGSGFWQAAWVTSTLFGFVHTGNNGENWVGIFAAGAIGFVFCASIRLTGSAWWAIGCHAAWDWAETYFYGTADSGMVAKGHLLTTTPAGAVMWSGGSDGPEGSLLVIAIILLLLGAVVLLYGRPRRAVQAVAPLEQTAG